MNVKCAECKCAPLECVDKEPVNCTICVKEDLCCCINIHNGNNNSKVTRYLQQLFISFSNFFRHTRNLYATALGIEILCICASEIGENSGFLLFDYRTAMGITLGYVLGYGLSTFTTFATILGRSNYSEEKCSCCSVLEQDYRGFVITLLNTLRDFTIGIKKMAHLYKQPNLKTILWTSIIILVTAETGCILTAETIDLIFYRHSLFISIPLSLFAGAFAVVAPEAFKRTRSAGVFPKS